MNSSGLGSERRDHGLVVRSEREAAVRGVAAGLALIQAMAFSNWAEVRSGAVGMSSILPG
jgi:hypothetical protein